MALDTASSGAPLAAVVIEVTMPEMLVPAPSRTAPISASPRPVRSASTSAMAAILLPKKAISSALAMNSAASQGRGRDWISGMGLAGRAAPTGYRSNRRGISSTKLQGRWRLSSWSLRILSHPSFTAPFDPGRAKTKVSPASTAQARLWIVEVPMLW